MAILSKESLLGASDLVTREVELPSIGGSVVVRSLPAAYSNMAQSEALELVTVEHRGRQQQSARINTAKLEELQVLHALVEPKLNSIEEAQAFSQKCGPAWQTLVKVIDEISGIDKEAIEKTNATFRAGGSVEAGAAVGDVVASGNGRSDLLVRSGA